MRRGPERRRGHLRRRRVAKKQLDELRAYWDENETTLSKKKATATYAKAKETIENNLLDEARSSLWTEWLATRAEQLGVE